MIAYTKPKKASKFKKAANKAIATATEMSLVLTITHIATTQGQIANEIANTQSTAASIRTKKASKAKKANVKGAPTDTELLETPKSAETATRQIEASAITIWPPKFKGEKAANKGPNSAYEICEAPPTTQMVTNQGLAATLWVRRGSRAQKAATKGRAVERQPQIVDQGAQVKMGICQTNISALETQVLLMSRP